MRARQTFEAYGRRAREYADLLGSISATPGSSSSKRTPERMREPGRTARSSRRAHPVPEGDAGQAGMLEGSRSEWMNASFSMTVSGRTNG